MLVNLQIERRGLRGGPGGARYDDLVISRGRAGRVALRGSTVTRHCEYDHASDECQCERCSKVSELSQGRQHKKSDESGEPEQKQPFAITSSGSQFYARAWRQKSA